MSNSKPRVSGILKPQSSTPDDILEFYECCEECFSTAITNPFNKKLFLEQLGKLKGNPLFLTARNPRMKLGPGNYEMLREILKLEGAIYISEISGPPKS